MSHATATVLGLAGFGLFIVAVVASAAGITWLVVKLSPLRDAGAASAQPAPPPATASRHAQPRPGRGSRRRASGS